MRIELRQPVPVSFLDDTNLILPSRANVLRRQVEHALTRHGMKFRLAIEADTLGLCSEFAAQGIGVTVVPASSLQQAPGDARLAWAPIKGLFVTWALYENEARAHAEGVRAGRRLVLRIVRERTKSAWQGAEFLDRKHRKPTRHD